VNNNSAYNFYQLRVPLFPVESILELNRLLADWKESRNEQGLKAIFSDPLLLESIYLSSRDMYYATMDWLRGDQTDGRKSDKIILSLYRYYSRLCLRPTPYGICSGVATGEVAAGKTDIRLDDEDRLLRFARFDMDFLGKLVKKISSDQRVMLQLTYFPNSTIYRAGNKYRFVEGLWTSPKKAYHLTAISASDYTTFVLETASDGVTVHTLVEQLFQRFGMSKEKLTTFVLQLVASDFLVSELIPNTTGRDNFESILGKLNKLKGIDDIMQSLREAGTILKKASGGLSGQLDVEKTLTSLVTVGNMELIQVDLRYQMKANRMSLDVIESIKSAAAKFGKISVAAAPHALNQFKIRFAERYAQREVPLAEALDTDLGVGYGLVVTGNVEPMPLLKNISIPNKPKEEKFLNDAFHKFLFEKVRSHLESSAKEIIVSDEEIDRLLAVTENNAPEVASSYIVGNLMASSEEEMDKGNFRFFVREIHTPFAPKILARFACWDEQLQEFVSQLIRQEEMLSPDVLFAEIIHLADDKTGNILIRPAWRAYEIPYLSQSSVEREFQIPVDDLRVRLDNGRFILRSERLNKQIVPRLTNAHNYKNGGLPVYRFLCDVQFDGMKSDFIWDWKSFSYLPFLPRVSYRNLILCRARWLFPREDKSDTELAELFRSVRAQYNIPRYVLLWEGGGYEFLVDCENDFCLRNLYLKWKKNPLVLYEFLAMPDNCFLSHQSKKYTTDMVIPVGREAPEPVSGRPSQGGLLREDQSVRRSFIPGTEWLFLKIYASWKTIDSIIADIIQPFIEDPGRTGRLDKWFFIRYDDPEPHLRIRFYKKGAGPEWCIPLLDALNSLIEPLIQQRLVTRVVLDTYERELERYAHGSIDLSESIFFHDSVAITGFLARVEGEAGEELRWKFGFYSVYRYLTDLQLTSAEKKLFLDTQFARYFKEFNHNKPEGESELARSLNEKYRTVSRDIEKMLHPAVIDEEMRPLFECFDRRSAAIGAHAEEIQMRFREQPGYPDSYYNILASFIHMSVNRLFCSQQRMHELVIYHHLKKYLASREQRQQPGKGFTQKAGSHEKEDQLH
jgi:thiopeptide-type bacteriocin biosynthesis protein